MAEKAMIYELIGKAIGKIGAIGKDQMNLQQKFKYRGIDQVYNALNPVLSDLGIFFVPEVLDLKREERETKSGTLLTYTILTMKYTVYAPDGSNVCMTVVGEGMDSGDKGCNKAMSVAMKYAMFQLLCIPTEELKDPDADVYTDVLPKGKKTAGKPENGTVEQTKTLPPNPEPVDGEKPGAFLQRRITEMKAEFKNFDFLKIRKALIDGGVVPDIPSATMTMEQAKNLADAVYKTCAQKVPA